jgi:hypothetical protein
VTSPPSPCADELIAATAPTTANPFNIRDMNPVLLIP